MCAKIVLLFIVQIFTDVLIDKNIAINLVLMCVVKKCFTK